MHMADAGAAERAAKQREAAAAEEASAKEDENEDEELDITVTGIVSIVVPIFLVFACAALRIAQQRRRDTSAGVTMRAPQPRSGSLSSCVM